MQVVHFHERNSGGVVYPAHDGGVVTRWKVCDDRRFARVRRSVAAVLNVLHLLLVMMPPMIVCCQLSLEAIKAPLPLCSSNVGSARDSERHTG